MMWQKKSPIDFTVEELDREIIARGARMPPDKRFEFDNSVSNHQWAETMKK
ncbi:MAG: hypothetical protein GY757_20650, partial [bacterium]|nr:hypothetical protein [bacterium]